MDGVAPPLPVNQSTTHHCEMLFGIDYGGQIWFKLGVEVLFFIVFAVASVQYVRIARADPFRAITPQKVFHLLSSAGFFAALIFLPLPAHLYTEMAVFGAFMLNTLPSIILFSCYLLMFFYWAAVYHRAVSLFSKGFQHVVLKYYLAINVLAYLTMFALATYLQYTNATFSHTVHVSSYFVAGLSVFIAVIGIGYGVRVSCGLHQYPVVSVAGRMLIRKVGLITAICVVSFLIKAPTIVAINHYLCEENRITVVGYRLVWLGYLLVVDVIPTLLILFLIRHPPAVSRGMRYSYYTSDLGTSTGANKPPAPDGATGMAARHTPISHHFGADAFSSIPDEMDPLYMSWATPNASPPTSTPGTPVPLTRSRVDGDAPSMHRPSLSAASAVSTSSASAHAASPSVSVSRTQSPKYNDAVDGGWAAGRGPPSRKKDVPNLIL